MTLLPNQLELLAPAKTADIGREAVLHGADAVYIGGPSFGARLNASNSVSDIGGLADFAHRYHARIFVTLNTILHDAELEPARTLIYEFYDAGVDALIVQDMGLLELDLVLTRYLQGTPYDAELDEFLDLADNDLWDIVSGRSDRYDARFGGIVARLRAV